MHIELYCMSILDYGLTLLLLNCLFLFFIHLKMQLLKQFAASKDLHFNFFTIYGRQTPFQMVTNE